MLPRLVHFIFGMTPQIGAGEFGLHHYICIKSARKNYPDHDLVLWHAYQPEDNAYWRAAAGLCRMIEVAAPTQIFGNPLTHHAHRTDVLRLQVLIEYGGIYLDLDSIVVRPLTDQFVLNTLMGIEVNVNSAITCGLCNAMIAAAARASFLRRWLDCFEFFNSSGTDANYAFFASRLPLILARQRSDDVTILGHRAFFPYWCDESGLRNIFETAGQPPAETYSIHLWESQAKPRGHLQAINAETLFTTRSLYHELAARYVTPEELAEIATAA
jgi:hypothetical protein